MGRTLSAEDSDLSPVVSPQPAPRPPESQSATRRRGMFHAAFTRNTQIIRQVSALTLLGRIAQTEAWMPAGRPNTKCSQRWLESGRGTAILRT